MYVNTFLFFAHPATTVVVCGSFSVRKNIKVQTNCGTQHDRKLQSCRPYTIGLLLSQQKRVSRFTLKTKIHMVNFLQKIQRHLPDVQKIIKCTYTHIFTVKKSSTLLCSFFTHMVFICLKIINWANMVYNFPIIMYILSNFSPLCITYS